MGIALLKRLRFCPGSSLPEERSRRRSHGTIIDHVGRVKMKDSYFKYVEGPPSGLASVTLIPMVKDRLGLSWLVSGVETSRVIRNQGHMREVFAEVMADADREQVVLWLSVQPDYGVGVIRLVEFYMKHGFEYLSRSTPHTSMRRLPNTKGVATSGRQDRSREDSGGEAVRDVPLRARSDRV